MGARALEVGQRGEVDLAPQKRDDQGKWKRAMPRQKADRWRARCYYRDQTGVMRELSRFGLTRVAAEKAINDAFEQAESEHVEITAKMPFVAAGKIWLEHIGRTDSGLSERTITDYGRTWTRYIEKQGSAVYGLKLREVNSPQRLRKFLQGVADAHGTGAAKITRSVLTGILQFSVDNGVLPANAIRQVGTVTAQKKHGPRRKSGIARDTTRAFTRQERDAVVAFADGRAAEREILPQTRRKRQAVADLVAFLAGTGVRITEARRLRWEHVNLTSGRAEILGTKSKTSHRVVTLPPWLLERVQARAERIGTEGLVFGSPHHLDAGSREWDQSNCAKAVAGVLAGAGHPWATPHSFRRTVATLAHEGGAPLVAVADQLGHSDPTMTARVYLGRDPFGERASVAQYL